MLMNLEEEFGVTLEADATMTTVGALVARLEQMGK